MRTLLILFVTILFTGCSTLLTDSMNVSKTKNQYNKILVIGKSKDNITRINFEHNVANYFSENGITAVASSDYELTKTLKTSVSEPESQKMAEMLVSDGFDGVVLTSLIDTQQYQDVIPGNTNTMYYPTAYYGGFPRYYGYYPVTYWEPDQLVVGTNYIFESNLYKLNSDNPLQWIGRFSVDSNYDMNNVTDKYAKELVESLIKESVSQ